MLWMGDGTSSKGDQPQVFTLLIDLHFGYALSGRGDEFQES